MSYKYNGCSNLSFISFPESVTSIGDQVFWGCSSLTSFNITNSVTSIGESAFRECTSLTSITIPNSVKSVDKFAFYGCSGLTSVIIGNSVTSIGGDSFFGCDGISSIHCKCIVPPSNEMYIYPFSSVIYSNATLYVPRGSLTNYKSTEGWNYFKNIVEE